MSISNKIKDLKLMIGESVSENFSPTLRAKLIAIDETRNGGVCIMEVTPSPYYGSWSAQQNHTAGHRYERPIEYVWNAYFY